MYYLALLSYASKLENPSLAVLIVSLSETIPNFFQIFLGVLADSTKQRTNYFFQSGIVRGLIYSIIGIIILCTSSIYGILVIGILNAISDLFGRYVTLCIDPFVKFIVPKEDLERALSINFIIKSSIGMGASFLGAGLISLIGNYQLAFINAVTFFIVSVGVHLIRKQLNTIENKIDSRKHDNIKQVISHIIMSLKKLLVMKKMRLLFFIAAGLNSIAVTIIPISTIFLSYHPDNQVINIPVSIALIQGLIMISGITGNWLGAHYAKNSSVKRLLSFSFFGYFVYGVMVYIDQLWIGVLFLFLSIMATSIFNLKFSSDIIKSIPAEQMGTIYGCMDTFFLVVPSIISMFFLGLASINLKLYIVIVAVFCLFYLVFIQLQEKDLYFNE